MKKLLLMMVVVFGTLISANRCMAETALSADQERIQTAEGRPWILLTPDNLSQYSEYKEDMDFYAYGVHVKGDEAWRYNYYQDYGIWRIYTFKKGKKVAFRERYPNPGKYAATALDGMDRELFPNSAPKVSGSFIVWKNNSYMLILYMLPYYNEPDKALSTLGLSRIMVGGMDLIYLENPEPDVKDPFSSVEIKAVTLKPEEYPRVKVEGLIKFWEKKGLLEKETTKAIRMACLKKEIIYLKKVPGNRPPLLVVGTKIVIDKR